MRRLVYQRCDECRNEWKAPKQGACPRCRGSRTHVFKIGREEAPRA
jgi:Zn finger protein HypA/HybF involved in hydrogenase expression